MNSSNQTGSSRKQVFISYSHEPPENAEFVRWLAGNLRIAGFAPWLDEEQLWGGSVREAITEAVERSDAALFVVTNRWEDRDFTQHEVELFGEPERKSVRKVVLERETTQLKKLGVPIGRLLRIAWPAEDSLPDARFWQIYCGIEGLPPGPRDRWAENGARVLRRASTKPEKIEAEEEQDKPQVAATPEYTHRKARVALHCKGKPISVVTGPTWNFLVTDEQEWLALTAEGEPHEPFAGLAAHGAACIDASGSLLVGLYSAQIARLGEHDWEYLSQEAPVLSLCSCSDGDLAGTASGSVVLLKKNCKPVVLFRMRDSAIALAAFDGGIVTLGSRGAFGWITWPPNKDSDSFKWLEQGSLGRPAGLFSAVDQDHVGIFSDTRIGAINPLTGASMLCPRVFDEGIREVVFFGAQRWPYGVLTDTGNLIFIDNAFYQTSQVRFPGSALVRGCASGGWSGISTAWTYEGSVYRLAPDATATRIAEGNALLAYSPPGDDKLVHVVRWTAADGVQVEIGKY